MMPSSKGTSEACAKPIAAGTPEFGDRHDHVGAGGWSLARELHAHLLADVVDGAPVDDEVGPREIDVLEDAGPRRAHGEGAVAFETGFGDDDDLAVLHLAQELGADHVERAGLGGEHVGGAEPADDERADADGIARADQHLVGQTHERIGALDLAQRFDEALDDAALLRARQEMQDDLGVGGRLADGAGGDELLAQGEGVREVAVVGDGEAAGVDIGKQRLHVAQDGIAAGRVAIVADGDVALQALDDAGAAEVVADEAHAALGVELPAVVGDDAAGFLSAVLEGVQAERGDGGGVGVPKNTKDPAFLAESVVVVARGSRSRFVARPLRAEESWSPPAGGLPLPDEGTFPLTLAGARRCHICRAPGT